MHVDVKHIYGILKSLPRNVIKFNGMPLTLVILNMRV